MEVKNGHRIFKHYKYGELYLQEYENTKSNYCKVIHLLDMYNFPSLESVVNRLKTEDEFLVRMEILYKIYELAGVAHIDPNIITKIASIYSCCISTGFLSCGGGLVLKVKDNRVFYSEDDILWF